MKRVVFPLNDRHRKTPTGEFDTTNKASQATSNDEYVGQFV
jgi:hypothetical protein